MLCRRSAVVLLLLALVQLSVAQQCRVSYSSQSKKPLLFGGVIESCSGLRCQSRDDYYGKKCGAADASSWGVCSNAQYQSIVEYARTVMGEGMNLSPCELVTYLQGRTLWLIGDSHTKSLWAALQCFLIDFWERKLCAPSTDEAAVTELANLPKVKGYSNCIHLLGPAGGRVCVVEVVLGNYLTGNSGLAAGGVLPLLRQKFAQPQDIFYINFGAWHRKNAADWANFAPALEALGQDYAKNKAQWPHVLFRENSAIHLKNLEAKVCGAVAGYEFQASSGQLTAGAAATAAADGGSDLRYQMGLPLMDVVNEVLPKHGIHIVHSFNYTVPLHQQHIEMRHVDALDCIHYCMPGVPQMWIWDLYKALRSGAAGIKPLKVTQQSRGSGGSIFGGFGGASSSTTAVYEEDSSAAAAETSGSSSSSSDTAATAPPSGGGARATASSSPAAGASSPARSSAGRLFDALRLPLGRRLLGQSGAQSSTRLLQAQKYACVPPKVTF